MKNKKNIFILITGSVLLIAIVSSYIAASRTEIPIQANFPLKLAETIPFDDAIEKLAVADTWIAVATANKITAIDLDTQKIRWTVDFTIASLYSNELKIIGDNVIAVGRDQIILIDKAGRKKPINLLKHSIISMTILDPAAVAPNNIYIIRNSERSIEAYDLTKNEIVWSLPGGRGANIFLDPTTNIAYIATASSGSIRAVDNTTGDILWQQEKNLSTSIYENGFLYVCDDGLTDPAMQLFVMDVKTQNEVWRTQTRCNDLTVMQNLVIASGSYGIVAINKLNGKILWQHDNYFYTGAVEFDGVIYIKDASFRINAISPVDGKMIGYIKLENPNPFLLLGREANAGVHRFKDGIIFNLSNAVVIYEK
jgi:outer membrane protein assembly factor BamB